MTNDEITLVRMARPEDPPDVPAARERAWARLRAEIDAPPARPSRLRVPRTPRIPWRIAASAVAAAGAAVAIAVAQSGGTGPAASHRAGGDATVRFLETAATTVAHETSLRPRPDQWIYVRKLLATGHGPEKNETWWRFDGTRFATVAPGTNRVVTHPTSDQDEGHDPSPRASYDYVRHLPTGTHALLVRLRRDGVDAPGEDANDRVFSQVAAVFANAPVIPPKVTAALYRVLAELPGVHVSAHVTDLAGRRGVAVTRDGTTGLRELILDPRTYHYLGERLIATDHMTVRTDGHGGRQRFVAVNARPGQAMADIAVTSVRVVDAPGRRG